MKDIKNFFFGGDSPLEDLGGGVSRRIMAYNDNLMCVEIHFEEGAVGALHSHPHEQITYVLSGEFEFTIGGVKQIIKAGDSTYEQPDIEHGTRCLKAGVLLDVFTPHREDFL